ncbi:response regulator [Nitrospira sp. M1]
MIMVVTHQPHLRNELIEHLTCQGYEVLVPPHRQDVCTLVQEANPQVIVLDLYVADPNGLEIVERLRRQGFTGKILIIAGASVRSAVPEAFRLGADQAVGGPQGTGAPLLSGQVEATIRSFFHQEIQALAYKLYEERGRTPGRDWDDWFEAECQILNLQKSRHPNPVHMEVPEELVARQV